MGIMPQFDFARPAVRMNHMDGQRTPYIEMPHLIGGDAMKGREFVACQQEVNGGRGYTIAIEGWANSRSGNHNFRAICFAIISAFRMRLELQSVDPILRVLH